MSMLRIRPRHDAVVADAEGRPREIVLGPETVPISAIEVVREEVAAYPLGAGPRTMFIVRVTDRRYRLVREHRERRWRVESLEGREGALGIAA